MKVRREQQLVTIRSLSGPDPNKRLRLCTGLD